MIKTAIILIFLFLTEVEVLAGLQAPALTGKSEMETILSFGVLLFGLIIIGLQIGLLYRLKTGWGPNSLRMAGLTLVITSGIFLITAGYSQDQTGPMFALLGTIAGYLLGKSEKKE